MISFWACTGAGDEIVCMIFCFLGKIPPHFFFFSLFFAYSNRNQHVSTRHCFQQCISTRSTGGLVSEYHTSLHTHYNQGKSDH
jgi:hypothetical protein